MHHWLINSKSHMDLENGLMVMMSRYYVRVWPCLAIEAAWQRHGQAHSLSLVLAIAAAVVERYSIKKILCSRKLWKMTWMGIFHVSFLVFQEKKLTSKNIQSYYATFWWINYLLHDNFLLSNQCVHYLHSSLV